MMDLVVGKYAVLDIWEKKDQYWIEFSFDAWLINDFESNLKPFRTFQVVIKYLQYKYFDIKKILKQINYFIPI